MTCQRREWLPEDEPGYADRVKAMAVALHEDCRLEWQAIAVVDPGRMVTMHGADAHYGKAHDLVRRLAKRARSRSD